MVDFEWYRSFIAIYKHNSVSEAAKTRMMTQPAMSQHLSALEAEVGEPLFTRTSRKLTPTERGKELYSQVAPLIERLEETTVSLKAASLPTLKVIRIGTAHEFYCENILPRLNELNMCTVSYFGTADQLLEILKEDKADIIFTSKKFIAPGIEYVKLYDEEFAVVAPAHMEVPDTDRPTDIEQWLCAQKWISYGLELPIIRRLWRQHFQKRPLIKPVHVIPNLHMILRAIENGSGISVLPTYLLRQPNEKAKIILEQLKVTNELYIAYQMKHKHLQEMGRIVKIIRENE
ncbi:LysR family transcriptional regulator [Paenibacillus hamazuiensis]|uniref:LysR family transcriptional regulator n=1 Tax=Paenibacillus hamazuiensis TaxID=2936508 RepID=UPI00200DFE63|nr:LysR family transcriptional regulator [Paenibacillus hamazuiensis]